MALRSRVKQRLTAHRPTRYSDSLSGACRSRSEKRPSNRSASRSMRTPSERSEASRGFLGPIARALLGTGVGASYLSLERLTGYVAQHRDCTETPIYVVETIRDNSISPGRDMGDCVA